MEGGYVVTGKYTYVHTWMARKSACRVEARGMRFKGGSIRAKCKRDLGLPPNAALEAIEEAIDARCEEIVSGERQGM